MTMLSSPRPLPTENLPTDRAVITVPDIVAVMQRSNHATAFAAWTVTTIATGLAIQADTLRANGSGTIALVLAGLVLPVLATAGRATILLVRAGRAARQAEASGTGAASAEPPATTEPAAPPAKAAPDRLTIMVAALGRRDALARRAQLWAGAAGIAFLAWTLLAVLLPAGG